MIDVVRVIVDELGAEELAGFRSDCHRLNESQADQASGAWWWC